MINLFRFVLSILFFPSILLGVDYTLSSIEGTYENSYQVSQINNRGEICGHYSIDSGSSSIDKNQHFVFIWQRDSGMRSIKIPTSEIVKEALPDLTNSQNVEISVQISNINITNCGKIGFNLKLSTIKPINTSFNTVLIWDGYNNLTDVGKDFGLKCVYMLDINDNDELLIAIVEQSFYNNPLMNETLLVNGDFLYINDTNEKLLANVATKKISKIEILKPQKINNRGELFGNYYSTINMIQNISSAAILFPNGDLLKFPLGKIQTVAVDFNDSGFALVHAPDHSCFYLWDYKNQSFEMIKQKEFLPKTNRTMLSGNCPNVILFEDFPSYFHGINLGKCINNKNKILGYCNGRSAIWKNGQISILDDTLKLYEDCSTDWSTVSDLLDINDLGEVLGLGTKNHVPQPIILSPNK